jgi:FkbM family methyltransferase
MVFQNIARRIASRAGLQTFTPEELSGRIRQEVERAVAERNRASFYHALQACVKRGHKIGTVIDVGASNGCWSEECLKQFPDAHYLLLDAQPVHEAALAAFCRSHPRSQFCLAAAGNREGEIFFHGAEPFGGIASDTPFPDHNLRVPLVTLDAEISRRGLPGPYLLKLDTHGYEVPIFEGATDILKQAELLIVECYNFKIAEPCLLFYELAAYLEERGFRPADIFDLLHRPDDEVFWQMDCVFLRTDHPAFSSNAYEGAAAPASSR